MSDFNLLNDKYSPNMNLTISGHINKSMECIGNNKKNKEYFGEDTKEYFGEDTKEYFGEDTKEYFGEDTKEYFGEDNMYIILYFTIICICLVYCLLQK